MMTPKLKAIAKIKDWSEVYHLAQVYRQQQQWQEAAIALQRAVELKSDFWSYHHLGDALSQLQQWQNAAAAYNQAIKLDSQFFWSWHNLGDALSQLQQWQNAAAAYDQAIKLDSQFFWSWHNLGDALSQLQQWRNAAKAYLQGIYLQPDHQLSYQKLGRSFKQQGELTETVKQYRQIFKTPPENSIFKSLRNQPQQLIKLVHNLIQQHQIYGAIIVCYWVLEIQPTQVNISATLTQLLRQYQEVEQAITQNQQKLAEHTASPIMTQLATDPIATKQSKPISGKIVIQHHNSLSANQLNNLWTAVGWSSRPLTKLEQALEHSFTYITAWHIDREQEQLVGFVRAVSDGVYQATLLDVAVHPDFQGRGIGKTIVKTIIKQLQAAQIADITLFASPQLTDFYHKLGFVAQPKNLQWMLLTNSTAC
ncbi:MAG: GNAT family N-acetyltransferase [Cyanobacteria bacterium P01_C01_bin.72]